MHSQMRMHRRHSRCLGVNAVVRRWALSIVGGGVTVRTESTLTVYYKFSYHLCSHRKPSIVQNNGHDINGMMNSVGEQVE